MPSRLGATVSVQILLDLGADVHAVDFRGMTAVHHAAFHNKVLKTKVFFFSSCGYSLRRSLMV